MFVAGFDNSDFDRGRIGLSVAVSPQDAEMLATVVRSADLPLDGRFVTRTTFYKGVYFAMLGGGGIITLSVLAYFRFSLPTVAAVVVASLIPGRMLGYFWRDLLRGLRLLNAKDYAASKFHSERFLVEVRKKPWIKHFVWLGSSIYSRDPEVLALNNLGAAEIGLGKFDPARVHLQEAIAKDALCPLPFYNLGVLFKAMDDTAESQRCFAQATRLGYRHGISDKIVRASQKRFANTDGR